MKVSFPDDKNYYFSISISLCKNENPKTGSEKNSEKLAKVLLLCLECCAGGKLSLRERLNTCR